MKRRNAETGKMRRPVKRTKITEGMYGSSMLYLKFVMLWATVVMADYMLEFRFEFLWPFWMMLRSVYDSFKYQGLAFSVFFICIALTSDMICFFFIPLHYIFFAASTYVWVQYCWYTFADKGICVPTVIVCCFLVYIEGVIRGERGGVELWCRPLAAHCVGYPVVTLGFGVKSYVGHRLRLRRQRQVRAENEFYFQLMKDALPEAAVESQQSTKESERSASSNGECVTETRHMNGSVKRNKCKPEQNGVLHDSHNTTKVEKADKGGGGGGGGPPRGGSGGSSTHVHSNGHHTPPPHTHPPDIEDRHDHNRGSAKSSKCEKKEAISVKEEKRKNRNKDKDKDNNNDSHKSTEQTKEQIVKEVESTKENHIRNHKDCNNYKEKDRESQREKDKERERDREREKEQKEREREREREKEKELCVEELRRVRAELSAALRGEAEARRALQAAAAAERQARNDHAHLKLQHTQLQHKVSSWRSGERATLERRLTEERRARNAAEHQLRNATRMHNVTPNGECESSYCRTRRLAWETEAAALRRDLRKAHERYDQLQRDLAKANDQARVVERNRTERTNGVNANNGEGRLAGAVATLQERALHLERSLSAETRVKLDLLSALGDAKRQLHIQEGLISKQDKEIEELKAQMLAVMPTEYVTPVSGNISKIRLENSALDPNASVYTPKQLCSDA